MHAYLLLQIPEQSKYDRVSEHTVREKYCAHALVTLSMKAHIKCEDKGVVSQQSRTMKAASLPLHSSPLHSGVAPCSSNNNKTTHLLIEISPCVRHCARDFTCIYSFNLQNNSIIMKLHCFQFIDVKTGQKRQSDSSESTQLSVSMEGPPKDFHK